MIKTTEMVEMQFQQRLATEPDYDLFPTTSTTTTTTTKHVITNEDCSGTLNCMMHHLGKLTGGLFNWE